MIDYKKVTAALREYLNPFNVDNKSAFEAAIALCELAAKATTEIDPDEERARCEHVVDVAMTDLDDPTTSAWAVDLVAKQREEARTQTVLAAHAAYRELTDALAEFFYSHDPSDLKRVERAFDKTRDL